MLSKLGLARNLGEGPIDYAERIADTRPDLALTAKKVIDAYVRQNYVEDDVARVDDIKTAIRTFRVKSLSV